MKLRGACVGGGLHAFVYSVRLRAHVAFAAHEAAVEHAERRDGFEAFVGLRGVQRVAAASAYSEDAETVSVNAGI